MNPAPHRLRRILIALAVLAVALLVGRGLHLDESLAPLLPDSDRELADASQLITQLPSLQRMVLDLGPAADAEEVDRAVLGRAADRLAERLRAVPGVHVRASLQGADALDTVDTLIDRCGSLLTPEDLQALADSLTPDAMAATLGTLQRRLQEPDSGWLRTRAAKDPLGLSDRALRAMQSLGETLGDARALDQRLVSADGRHVLVLVEPGFSPSRTERTRELLAVLDQAVAGIHDDPELAAVQVRHLGPHRATLDNSKQIRRDVPRTSIAGGIALILISLVFFGRLRVALLALTPALFGGAVAWGLFALFQDTIPAPVAGFGAVLVGLTIDFAVHVMARLRSGGPDVRLPARALWMGATTTAVAFLTLRASSLPGLRDIGMLGALGIPVATLFALAVLPALHGVGAKGRGPLLDARPWIARLRSGKATVIGLLLVAVATLVLAPGLGSLRFDGDVKRLSSLTPETQADEDGMERTWGDVFRLTSVIVRGDDLEQALARNDRVARILDGLVESGGVASHASIARVLPSQEIQAERHRAWREFWSPEHLATFRADFEEAVASTKFRAAAFQPMFDWLAREPVPVQPEDYDGGPLAELLHENVITHDGSVWVHTSVSTRSIEQVDTVRGALATEVPQAVVLNREAVVRKVSDMIGGETWKLTGLAVAAVTAVVFLWIGCVELTLVIILPLLLSLVWTLGLLGWLGVPITLVNAIFVVFLFGAAVDYSIFLTMSRVERLRTGQDHTAEADLSVLLCALTTSVGLGSLMLADHPVVFSIGVTACLGILCSAATTMILAPALASMILRNPGANGAPGLRNMWGGFWVLWTMAGRGIVYLVFRRRSVPVERRESVAHEQIGIMARAIRDRLPCGRRTYHGEDDLIARPPGVMVSNHASMGDIMIILGMGVPTRILVKQWVWNAPVMGAMVREAGYLLVKEEGAPELIERAREVVESGDSILVFPEGQRSRTGRITRYHNGAFAIARALGVKVTPIALVNSGDIVPKGAWWIGDHDTQIVALEAMDPADYPGEEGDRRMARAARDRTRAAIRERWLQTQFHEPSWRKRIASMYRYLGPVVSHYAASKARRDPLVKELPRLVEGEDDVLVVGCGLGLLTARLALAFPERRVVGVDHDERKLQVLQAALGPDPRVELQRADIREVGGEYGTVLLVDVLHYWEPEQQEQLVRHVAGLMPAGGRLLFRDSASSGVPGHRLVNLAERFAGRIGFTRMSGRLHFRTTDGWRNLLERSGFTVENTCEGLGMLSNVVLVCRRT